MMVLSRWAIVMTVHSRNSLLMVFWMRSSVSRSTAAVASSNTRIFVLRRRARARQTNWHWPMLEKIISNVSIFDPRSFYLRFCPPSVSRCWSLFSKPETKDFRWALSNARHTWLSEYELKGSRFILSVPEKKTGSYNYHERQTFTSEVSSHIYTQTALSFEA